METKRLFITVTINATGESVHLTEDMITDVTDNGDGTSTVHTRHEGSQVVREPADWIIDSVKKLRN